MQHTSVFAAVVALIALLCSTTVSADSCMVTAAILQCSVTGPVSSLNTSLYSSSDSFNSITVTYSGTVSLYLITLSTKPISIKPMADTDMLQISGLSTSASRIDIWISLSAARLSMPLFMASPNYALTPSSSLSINIKQNVVDVSTFALFASDNSPRVTFANYEVVFDRSVSNAGVRVMRTVNAPLFYVVLFFITVDLAFVQSRQSIGQRVKHQDIRQQPSPVRGWSRYNNVQHCQKSRIEKSPSA